MNGSPPKAGTVFRYAYLWADEQARGREEGRKDRPALAVAVAMSTNQVVALAITHTTPFSENLAVELPAAVKRRLGLDDEPSWIVVTEANVFSWPGPDLRNIPGSDPPTFVYGRIPASLLSLVARRLLDNRKQQRLRLVTRTT